MSDDDNIFARDLHIRSEAEKISNSSIKGINKMIEKGWANTPRLHVMLGSESKVVSKMNISPVFGKDGRIEILLLNFDEDADK